jgi:hypothetical protein
MVPRTPNAALLALVPFLALPARGPGVVQADERRSQGAPPERRLAGTSEFDLPADPLDWVLDKVAAETDEWSSERIQDELSGVLHALTDVLASWDPARKEAGGIAAADLAPLLAPGLRGWLPVPRAMDLVHSAPGLEVRHGSGWSGGDPAAPEDGGDLDAGTLAGGLSRLLEGMASVDKAKFKVFRVEADPQLDPQGARGLAGVSTRVLFEADGRARGTGWVQLRAIWDLDWVGQAGSWRMHRFRPRSLERAEAKSRPFADVTAAVLGGNSSYREQLEVGLDAWMRRLDSASGIDIYGHQGVAVGDFDGDGWEDFYVAQPSGLPNRLYRNRGGASFEDVTASAGVGVLDATGGALFLDLDGDTDLDLAVVTFLEVILFENLGGGKFRRRLGSGLERAGEKGASSLGCAAADYDLDGDLDLYVICYLFWAGAGSKTHSSYPYPYHDAQNGVPNYLVRNEGGFRFTDVTRESGLDVNNRRFSLAASWADYDDDGDPDLYVANDFGRNNLYQNRGDGTFEDVAGPAGVEDTGNGMSVAWEDYDADGRLDLYVGNMWSSAGNRLASQPGFGRVGASLAPLYRRMARGNSLFRNLGGGRFEDVTLATGTAFGRWAWSSLFIDHDGDGREDIYIVNGFVSNEEKDDL